MEAIQSLTYVAAVEHMIMLPGLTPQTRADLPGLLQRLNEVLELLVALKILVETCKQHTSAQRGLLLVISAKANVPHVSKAQ